jgi:hypothetical protein
MKMLNLHGQLHEAIFEVELFNMNSTIEVADEQ